LLHTLVKWHDARNSHHLDHGATVSYGDSPLHLAAAWAKNSSFWKRLTTCNLCANAFLLESLRARNYASETPLHRAAAMGNLEAVFAITRTQDWLAGGSPGDLDNQGRTVLWHAACSNSSDIMATLTRAIPRPDRRRPWTEKGSTFDFPGSILDLPDDNGLAPVHVACRLGHADALKVLLFAGASPRAPVGSTSLLPAHFAAFFGHAACLELLLEHSAPVFDLDHPNEIAISPLHLAVSRKHDKCAALLAQADPRLSDLVSTCVVERDGDYILTVEAVTLEKARDIQTADLGSLSTQPARQLSPIQETEPAKQKPKPALYSNSDNSKSTEFSLRKILRLAGSKD
jgi:ankyrin repeat protein